MTKIYLVLYISCCTDGATASFHLFFRKTRNWAFTQPSHRGIEKEGQTTHFFLLAAFLLTSAVRVHDACTIASCTHALYLHHACMPSICCCCCVIFRGGRGVSFSSRSNLLLGSDRCYERKPEGHVFMDDFTWYDTIPLLCTRYVTTLEQAEPAKKKPPTESRQTHGDSRAFLVQRTPTTNSKIVARFFVCFGVSGGQINKQIKSSQSLSLRRWGVGVSYMTIHDPNSKYDISYMSGWGAEFRLRSSSVAEKNLNAFAIGQNFDISQTRMCSGSVWDTFPMRGWTD